MKIGMKEFAKKVLGVRLSKFQLDFIKNWRNK